MKGVGNAGRPMHPQPRVQKNKSTRAESPQVHQDPPGIPARNGFTACFALSSVTGLVCHRRLRFVSANLTPASGRQDHPTSPSASARFVKRAAASTASRTNVRDDRETPLQRGGTAVDMMVFRVIS